MRIIAPSRQLATGRQAAAGRIAAVPRSLAKDPITPGIVAWHSPRFNNFSDNAGLTPVVDNGNVAVAQSLVGKDPAIQATLAARPTYKATGLNGAPSWSFDGGDYLKHNLVGAGLAGVNKPFTVVSIHKVSAVNATAKMLWDFGSVSNVNAWHFYQFTTSVFAQRRDDAAVGASVGAQFLADTNLNFYVTTFDGVTMKIYRNGGTAFLTLMNASAIGTFTANLMGYGARVRGAVPALDSFWTGDIADVITYNFAFADYQAAQIYEWGKTLPYGFI